MERLSRHNMGHRLRKCIIIYRQHSSTAAQLAYMVNDEHKDFSGNTVTQTDNIDLSGHYLKVFGKYYLQGIGLLDVEPCALQTFLIGGFDVQERVVDEEALLSRSSYLANCMMIYL